MNRLMHRLLYPCILPITLCSALLMLLGCSGESGKPSSARGPTPVEVAPVTQGLIRSIRTFSGNLEASATFTVSPKVTGRVESISVDIGDAVKRGDVLVILDAAEFEQALAQAEANRLVAKANLAQAKSLLEITQRAMERAEALRTRGVTSDAELDAAKSDFLAKEAGVAVYAAQLSRVEAELESARIRLGYTRVQALWSGEDSQSLVAERYVDEGQTVAVNSALLKIVEVGSLSGVFFVTEKDYANLKAGQVVTLITDAYPDETFPSTIARIAPVFQESSRQARVELTVPNADGKLKPGMFIRANVEVDRVENATIIPHDAIVKRDNVFGVFQVSSDRQSATWSPVTIGIREGQLVEVSGNAIEGEVITLGQQLIDDGAAIRIAEQN